MIDFQKFFDVVPATTPARQTQAYRLRYRVYCQELGYEPKEKYPDQHESDRYDDSALHCLVIHRRSRIAAGCVRLLPAVDFSGNPQGLPLVEYAPTLLTDQKHFLHLASNKICEISRLAVDRRFRKKHSHAQAADLRLSAEEQAAGSMITLACFLGAVAMTEISGYTQAFSLMAPMLPRLLKQAGIPAEKVGPDIDFRGARAVYFIRAESALQGLRKPARIFYDWLYPAIEPELRRHIIECRQAAARQSAA